MEVKFNVQCQMESSWVPQFLGMLKTMEQLGKLGGSRWVRLYSDGDGNFRPKFQWSIITEPASPQWVGDEATFDAG